MRGSRNNIIKVGFFHSLGNSATYSLDLIVASALINIAGLAVPLTVMQVYDRIIPYHATGSLMWLALGASIAILFETILKIIREKIGSGLSMRYEYSISNQCFEKVLRAPLEETEKENLNTLMDNLSAINIISTAYCKKILVSLIDFPFAILYLFTVWIIFPKVGHFLIWILSSMAIITIFFRPTYRYLHHRQKKDSNNCMDFIIESIKKVHFIKAFSLEERMLRSFEQEQFKLSKSDFWANISRNLPADLQVMISQLTILGCLIIGAPDVINRSTTIGVLVTSMLLSSRAIQSFQSLGSHWIRYGEIEIASKKVNHLMSFESSISEDYLDPASIRGNLTVNGLCYNYGLGEDDSVLGVNLDIKANEIVAVTGPNFISLSVLAEMMCALRKPPIGKIMLDEYNLEFFNRESLNNIIEYVPLNASLLPGTILDNIARFNPEHRLTAQQLADNIGLSAYASKLPKGLYTVVDRKTQSTLTSSFVQLISLARALVANPKVLIIDQIEIGLDQTSRDTFLDIIKQISGQMTIVLIGENQEVLNLADKVYRFENNEIICKLKKS
ncbi:MAG: ABC transporter transmembrane domain-containing protein [Oligoflexales bacterium]